MSNNADDNDGPNPKGPKPTERWVDVSDDEEPPRKGKRKSGTAERPKNRKSGTTERPAAAMAADLRQLESWVCNLENDADRLRAYAENKHDRASDLFHLYCILEADLRILRGLGSGGEEPMDIGTESESGIMPGRSEPSGSSAAPVATIPPSTPPPLPHHLPFPQQRLLLA